MTTELDAAAQAMDDGSEATRLAFFERLSDTELFLALEAEPAPGAETAAPQVFETEGARFVLAFDRAARLAEFAGGSAPYLAVSGRALVQMLAGQGIGLALNPEAGPAARLIIPDEIDWLHDQLSAAPTEAEARLVQIAPPPDLPSSLITALDRKLATAAGRARSAWLCAAAYDTGARGALLVFVDPAPGAEGALARAVQDALTFAGLEAAALDVSFTPSSGSFPARLAKVGLRFDLPEAARADARPAPGSDPDAPPILR